MEIHQEMDKTGLVDPHLILKRNMFLDTLDTFHRYKVKICLEKVLQKQLQKQ
jgi:hypothetical protein